MKQIADLTVSGVRVERQYDIVTLTQPAGELRLSFPKGRVLPYVGAKVKMTIEWEE